MSNEFDIYGDADTSDVADAQGHGGPDVQGDAGMIAPLTGAVGDGSPGVAVAGYPDLRAGVFGEGEGALGLYRVVDRASAGGRSSLPDYITKSWRWDDPQAINYDLNRMRGELPLAQVMSGAGDVASAAGDVADYVPLVPGIVPKGLHAFGKLMKNSDPAHIQDQIDELQDRQNQLRAGRGRQT